MTVPHSVVNSFVIAGRQFFHSSSQDAHGTRCSHWIVDSVAYDRETFLDVLYEGLGGDSMATAYYDHLARLPRARLDVIKFSRVKLLPVDQPYKFSADGRAFAVNPRPRAYEFSVDDAAVPFTSFADALITATYAVSRGLVEKALQVPGDVIRQRSKFWRLRASL